MNQHQYSRRIKNQEGISKNLRGYFVTRHLQRQNSFQASWACKYFHWSQIPSYELQKVWVDTTEILRGHRKVPVYTSAFHSRNPQPLAILLTNHYTKYHFSQFLPFLPWLHKQGKRRPSLPEKSLHSFPRHTIPWISQMPSATPAPSHSTIIC